MDNDQNPNQPQQQQPPHNPANPGDSQPQPPRRQQNWDTTLNTRALGLIVAVAAIIVVVGFGLSMCSRTTATAPGASLGDGYKVLEQRVDQAFENDTVPQSTQPTVPESEAGAQPPRTNGQDPAITAEERQMQDIQEQQRMMQQQEEMEDAQREAVPSILPEKPPRPVPLGGDNY